MRFINAITLATFAAAKFHGAGLQTSGKIEVTVCIDRIGKPPIFHAQAIAARIYDQIGIAIHWNRHTPECTAARNAIVVNILDETPPALHAGSLAVSAPFQGKDVVLYYDRVRAAGGDGFSILLGYVLAHEIAHIAQGITRHSEEGILKSHWDGRDRSLMRRAALRFTEEDIDLIRRGLRGPSQVPAE
jgi:hypothetical protein